MSDSFTGKVPSRHAASGDVDVSMLRSQHAGGKKPIDTPLPHSQANDNDDDNSSLVSFDLDTDSEHELEAGIFTAEGSAEISHHSHIHSDSRRRREGITGAYLDARIEDQTFHRELQLDRERRRPADALGRHSSNPLTSYNQLANSSDGPHALRRVVQQRHFLGLETMRSEDPYFGIETLKSYNGLSNMSPDSVPEDMSACDPPRGRNFHSRTPTSNIETAQEKLPKACLRLIANFPSVPAGQYTLYLRTKQVGYEVATARFSVRILVRYARMGITETYYTRFYKSAKDEYEEWHYLKAECQFEVRPYTDIAHVNIKITPDATFGDHQRGQLWIRSLELVPVGMRPLSETMLVFSRVSQADYSLATQPLIGQWGKEDLSYGGRSDYASHTKRSDGIEDQGVVTRLAISKNGDSLAALTVFTNHFTIQVWHKDDLKGGDRFASMPEDISHHGAISQQIPCEGAQDVLLELAISASGEHIAVYHAPKIDDWHDDTHILKSDIGVRLFRNPFSSSSPLFIPSDDRMRHLVSLDPTTTLKSAVGYATFVDAYENGAHSMPARFVFCNGLYLDIYELHDKGFAHSHSISLVNMTSSLWRTTACKLMIRSITTNLFIWIEDNGRYCSTWDLSNGSAIGRMEISSLQYAGYGGSTAMRVASNQNVIAIVGYDNSITTVDSSSGILISRRVILDRTIERIAFLSAQSQMLLVMVRGEDENQQTVLTMDPLRLDTEGQAGDAPPISRSNVFGLFGAKKWPEIGIFCQADGCLVHFYHFAVPIPSVNIGRAVDPLAVYPYEIRITAPRLKRYGAGSGGGQGHHKRQVEIWKKSDPMVPLSLDSCVFSFIPEPWEQHVDISGRILSTGDCFVVHGNWTIQIWSLPTSYEPRCKLLFFWSSAPFKQSEVVFGKSEQEIVLDCHSRFSSTFIHTVKHEDKHMHFKATVVFQDSSVQQVIIPSSPTCYSDSQTIVEHCIKSIWLLALTHTIVSAEHHDMQLVDQQAGGSGSHAWAILEFVNAYINHTIDDDQDGKQTVLKRLLAHTCINGMSANFITALLEHADCSWLPCNDRDTDPLLAAIELRNTTAVRAILDYCSRKATTSHPTYVMPVEHSFVDLSTVYPELLQDFFRKASYIPAQRVDFNAECVSVSSFEWGIYRDKLRSWFARRTAKRPELVSGKEEPIFSFQLRENSSAYGIFDKRATVFKKVVPPKAITLRYDCGVYVAPFPSLIGVWPAYRFSWLAGKDFFDSPALMAILRYKTWQYGLFYWIFRLFLLFVFYGTFLTTTTGQLRSSSSADAPAEPLEHYLGDHWITIPIVGIIVGSILLMEELCQLLYFGTANYLRSLYNYIDVTSIVFTITCLGQTIHAHWYNSQTGVHQFGLTSLAIAAMYIHLIAETRIFRRIGAVVNIIVLIVSKVWQFFLVFALLVVGFTHALFYLFHAYQTKCDSNGVCKGPYTTPHSNKAFPSFVTTFFFLAGKYDTVTEDFEREDTHFLILISTFYLFTGIILLNLLIAFMNNAFDAACSDAEQAWRMQLSEALAEAELVGRVFSFIGRKLPFLRKLVRVVRARVPFWRRRAQHPPTFIYYVARVQDVEAYKSRLNKS